MGKDLKGRNLGKGICQRKDKRYSARFTVRYRGGLRVEKIFNNVHDAKKWLVDAQYAAAHGMPIPAIKEQIPGVTDGLNSYMTVDEWFEFWFKNLICDRAPNTQRNHKDRYERNIKPIIGNIRLCDLKPLHCKKVITKMETEDGYAGGTVHQAYNTMGSLLRSALDNGLIHRHPMAGLKPSKPVKAKDDIKVLTTEEQAAFLEVAKHSNNYLQYALILETGLRTSELIGLTWDNIDWKAHTLSVTKTLEYRWSTGTWRAGPPKTPTSYRTIQLTDKAYAILKQAYEERQYRKKAPGLSQELPYMDIRSGKEKMLYMSDLVFVNFRTGMPSKNSSYDTHLYKLCDKAGIRHFCMHALRHTFATRAIEAGVDPYVLQKILGHSSIRTTMDRYVHVTDDAMNKAVAKFQSAYGDTI